MTAPLVEFRAVGKIFPNGLVALRDVSFAIQPGTCHAVCGENGAGKSTLMKILFGLEQPSEGDICVGGAPARLASPRAAAAHGIGMVLQHFSLVPSLTVAENIVLGQEPRSGPLLDRAAARARVRALGARFRLEVDPDARVAALSVAAQQKVEILKTLSRSVRLLILDEPTAVLTPPETDELFDRLRDLRAGGLTIIFISHKLREVRALADHVTVLRGGRVTGDAPIGELDDDRIARLVMGADVRPVRRARGHATGVVVLEMDQVSQAARDPADRLDQVSLRLRAGEILGVAGVDGSGQRGLVSVLTGLARPDAGSIRLEGRAIMGERTARLRRDGMAYLPADRFQDGSARTLSLRDNAVAGALRTRALAWGPLLRKRACDARASRMIETYDVRCQSRGQALGALSGGNAQKLIAAREFGMRPRFLVVDQPTRGIDIRAAAFIHARLLELAEGGVAILLVTADLDELLTLSDRVVVMFAGRIAGAHDNGAELTPARLGRAMLGLEHAAG